MNKNGQFSNMKTELCSQCSKRIFKNQLDILSLELTASKECHQILPTTLSSGGKCQWLRVTNFEQVRFWILIHLINNIVIIPCLREMVRVNYRGK